MITWGTLAPEEIVSVRRQQDLELGAAVRYFNDRAVPEIGGMWFPMPLLWSVAAIAVAERTGTNPLTVANAVEARMMLGVISSGAKRDPRLRGTQKLSAIDDMSFAALSKRGVYVVQPLRMGMIQPLVSLGFATGGRYGALRLGTHGTRMMALGPMPEFAKVLERWVRAAPTQSVRGMGEVATKLSPLAPVASEVNALIRARIFDGGDCNALRRRALRTLRIGPTADMLDQDDCPDEIDPAHWRDMRAGAAFIDLRDAALETLWRAEGFVVERREAGGEDSTPAEVGKAAKDQLAILRSLAGKVRPRIVEAREKTSIVFAKECAEAEDAALMAMLVKRDGSALRLIDGAIVPGPAARDAGDTEEQENAEETTAESPAFAPQLHRLYNLHCLAHELNGEPNPHIEQEETTNDE
jgi:hypothetical protein